MKIHVNGEPFDTAIFERKLAQQQRQEPLINASCAGQKITELVASTPRFELVRDGIEILECDGRTYRTIAGEHQGGAASYGQIFSVVKKAPGFFAIDHKISRVEHYEGSFAEDVLPAMRRDGFAL
jgi:hypothetical protein